MTAPPAPSLNSDGSTRVPKRRCIEPNYGEAMIVLVGDPAREFIVRKDYICAKSKFFEAACSTRWLEGQEKTVELRDVEPTIFAQYVHWIYHNKLNLPDCADSSPVHRDELLDAYLLADRIDDMELRNYLVSQIHSDMRRRALQPGCDWLHRIFEGTSAGSPLRKLVVDWYVKRRTRDNSRVKEYPAEFVEKLLVVAFSAAPKQTMDAVVDPYLEHPPQVSSTTI
ncbi:hypothetical protein LTR95_013059 [Oleoguttula sp. CCFEE 5521]